MRSTFYIGRTFADLQTTRSSAEDKKIYGDKAEAAYELYFDRAALQGKGLEAFIKDVNDRGYTDLSRRALERYIEAERARERPVPAGKLKSYAEVLIQSGEFERAEQVLEEYIERNSSKRAAYSDVAKMLSEAGRYRSAERYWVKLLGTLRGSELSNAFNHLADIYYVSGRGDQLGPIIAQYIEESSSRIEARGAVLKKAAEYGDRARQIEQLEQIARTTDRTKQFDLGKVYWQTGQEDRARQMWAKWLESANSSDSEMALAELADFFKARGAYDEAIGYLDRALALSSKENKGTYYALRSQLHALSGEVQKSREDFEAAVEALREISPYYINQTLPRAV